MKIVFDTNVLSDAIVEGRGAGDDVRNLILAVARDEAEGFLAANCITDVYDVARKFLGGAKTRDAIYNLMAIFRALRVDEDDILTALEMPMGDFRAALLAVCASRAGADYVVTRDEDFLRAPDCPVKIVTPQTLLSILEGSRKGSD